MLRRRHWVEEVVITTVLLYELHSWNLNKNRKQCSESPGPTYQPKYRWDTHRPQITHPLITRIQWASARSRGDDRPTDTQADTQSRSLFFASFYFAPNKQSAYEIKWIKRHDGPRPFCYLRCLARECWHSLPSAVSHWINRCSFSQNAKHVNNFLGCLPGRIRRGVFTKV
jgi:hypothetical protein